MVESMWEEVGEVFLDGRSEVLNVDKVSSCGVEPHPAEVVRVLPEVEGVVGIHEGVAHESL